MRTSFSTEASFSTTIGLPDEELEAHCSDGLSLRGIDVLVITSGHEATDHRVYGKQAVSLRQFGANVTVVGALEHRIPGNVPVLAVPKPASRLDALSLPAMALLMGGSQASRGHYSFP